MFDTTYTIYIIHRNCSMPDLIDSDRNLLFINQTQTSISLKRTIPL